MTCEEGKPHRFEIADGGGNETDRMREWREICPACNICDMALSIHEFVHLGRWRCENEKACEERAVAAAAGKVPFGFQGIEGQKFVHVVTDDLIDAKATYTVDEDAIALQRHAEKVWGKTPPDAAHVAIKAHPAWAKGVAEAMLKQKALREHIIGQFPEKVADEPDPDLRLQVSNLTDQVNAMRGEIKELAREQFKKPHECDERPRCVVCDIRFRAHDGLALRGLSGRLCSTVCRGLFNTWIAMAHHPARPT